MLGQHDMEDGQDYVQLEQAEYDIVSGPQTRQGDPEQIYLQSNGTPYGNMESQMNISQNDSEMFHARSDAAMEINTDRQSMHDVEQGYFNAEKAVFE